MKIYIPILAAILLFGCKDNAAPPKQTQIVDGPDGLYIDSLLTPFVKALRDSTDNSAAMAIGIATSKKIIYAKSFGLAHLNLGIKADLNTQFHLASVSKTFTAVAIAKLIQDGKVKLGDLLIDHIPEFRMKGEAYNKITLRHILSHTSGIPRNIAADDWLKPSFGEKAMEENLGIVAELELDFEPGSKYSYSNSAFDILGIVVSRASNKAYHEYLQDEILAPLGMNHTSFIKPENLVTSNWAAACSYGLETQEWTPYPYNERLFPSSGVVASILDMCKWGQFQLQKGRLDSIEVLNEEYFELLVTPKFDTPWGDKIGMSWFLQSYLGRPIIMHTGFDSGFEAMMYIYPEDDVSIVILANRDDSRTGRLVNAASEVLFHKPIKDYQISARYKFARAYRAEGIEYAKAIWKELKSDSSHNFYVDDGDILSIGAILENGQKWTEAQEILRHYLTLNDQSTYAWRLLGNTHLNLGDSIKAKSCYLQCLKINPGYNKATIALEQMSKTKK